MALNKRQYVDGQTIVTASNLNEIQDCIITLENNYVPKTRTVAGKALSSNITLSAGDVGAVPTSRTINSKALTGNITLSAADVGAVPVARTVNSKALSSNITLNAADVGAVPTTRKVNNKALSADISLTASDVGAVPTGRKVNGKALSSDITLAASDVGAVPVARTVNGKALSANITLASSDIGDDSGAGGSTVKASLNSLNDRVKIFQYTGKMPTAVGSANQTAYGIAQMDVTVPEGKKLILLQALCLNGNNNTKYSIPTFTDNTVDQFAAVYNNSRVACIINNSALLTPYGGQPIEFTMAVV